MNKIECNLNKGVALDDLPVGTIFSVDGELFIKIDENAIYSNLNMEDLCYEAENGDCAAMIDRSSVPSAIHLSDGLAMYFEQHKIVDMAFNDATLVIK